MFVANRFRCFAEVAEVCPVKLSDPMKRGFSDPDFIRRRLSLFGTASVFSTCPERGDHHDRLYSVCLLRNLHEMG
jgi:hypothetical protein